MRPTHTVRPGSRSQEAGNEATAVAMAMHLDFLAGLAHGFKEGLLGVHSADVDVAVG